MRAIFGLAFSIWLVAVSVVPTTTSSPTADNFNAPNAAAILDSEMNWWLSWPNAARDRGTQCVSCHSVVPFVLARPRLHALMRDAAPTDVERRLWTNVETRVKLWNEIAPFYPDQTRGVPKTSESRGTESVLNALILATRDSQAGALSDTTRQAFDNMWALQMRTGPANGAWTWLNFHLEPFESDHSPFFGAALALEAVGVAPGQYAGSDQARDGVQRLRKYIAANFDAQNLLNRLTLLLVARRMPDVVTAAQREKTLADAIRIQNADGGWSAGKLGDYKRVDQTALDTSSDGYATGLALIGLLGSTDAAHQSAAARGRTWLIEHQEPSGGWPAKSLNRDRDPQSDPARFMPHVATGYAVVALTPR